MIKHVEELTKKSVKELEKDVHDIRNDIAKLTLEKVVQPVKDTNIIKKKKKQLAVLLTVLSSNIQTEKVKPVKVIKNKAKAK